MDRRGSGQSGGCGGGDRNPEVVFWPRPNEQREEKWVAAIIGILPKIHELKRLYISWERLSSYEQKNVASRIRKSADDEDDCHIRQNFRLTSYMIAAFEKWSMIQEEKGAPGCDVDVSCLSIRGDHELCNMIKIIQQSMKIIKEDKEVRRRFRDVKDKIIRSVIAVKATEPEPETKGITVTVHRNEGDRRIVHDLDAGGDTSPNESEQTIVISPQPGPRPATATRLYSSSSASSESKSTSSSSQSRSSSSNTATDSDDSDKENVSSENGGDIINVEAEPDMEDVLLLQAADEQLDNILNSL